MDAMWYKSELAQEIMSNSEIFDKTYSIISDIVTERLNLTLLVENMAGVLTNEEPENRAKGMQFFTKILKELPNDYLTEAQIRFVAKFYIDRLKDNHRVIPAVLEGFLILINMKNYHIQLSNEFFTVLFREVSCQQQLRQDRLNIYMIVKILFEKDSEYIKSLGPDFLYGFISSMDGERDPRNLIFLFTFIPKFLAHVSLGHLVEEMFDVISCYYPVDFHPPSDDDAPITRDDLATALAPCLCAIPEFGEQCLILLIEKLDSSLKSAKIDSLKLLIKSCENFKPEYYGPFLKALWSSIHREITHKSDEDIKIVAHEALSALLKNLSKSANTDQAFENFVKGVVISIQTAIAEANTVSQFVLATKVLLTTANTSYESCFIVTKIMIPSSIAYYGFKTSPKLQIATLEFLGQLYDMANHWEVLNEIQIQVNEIPQICLTAVSQPEKGYQIAGFRTLIKVINVLQDDLVVPFIEILIHNVQHTLDKDLLSVSVESVHAIARKYPELVMTLVVKGKCDLDNLTKDKAALEKRLNLLSNLASIDDFTKIILEEMLRLISAKDEEAFKVIEALNETISNSSIYNDEKLTQIESDHGLIESILSWILREIHCSSEESLTHGYNLIANTISCLPPDKQSLILQKYSSDLLEKCQKDDIYFMILSCLYSSLHNSVFNDNFVNILILSLNLSLKSDSGIIRNKACVLIAHLLNKAEHGQKFELLNEVLKNYLKSCHKEEESICPRLIILYGWIIKALIMRGNDAFSFWLQKITAVLVTESYCKYGSEAIYLIMNDFPDCLTSKHHCRISLLYKQRMYQSFSNLMEKQDISNSTKESCLQSWGYVLGKAPKSVLIRDVDKILPLAIDALDYDNKDLLLVMIELLCHFAQAKQIPLAQSLQTILPRLVNLSKYMKSMDVRIQSLQCLYDIASCFPTMLLIPFKQDVLFDLAPSLDDKKRLVRNMAVRARTRWFLVGAPGEAKDN